MSHAPRSKPGGGRKHDTDNGEDTESGAPDRIEIQNDERQQLGCFAVDIILDHHLKAEAEMSEDADYEQNQRERDGGI